MSTKQQEREALATIKQIIAELGPDSYLSIAFEGCFQDAEQNIENDFGCSMKQRLESAERKIHELEDKLSESEKDYEAAHAAAHAVADEKDSEIAWLKSTIEDLRKQTLSMNDLLDCKALADNEADSHERTAKAAADEIVKYAVTPDCEEFQKAVRNNRSHIGIADFARGLSKRIQNAINAINAGA